MNIEDKGTKKQLENIRQSLSKQQLEFIDYYIDGMTPIEAWVTSGLGVESEGKQALAMLRTPIAKKYIELINQAVSERSVLTLEQIDQELSDLSKTEIIDVVEIGTAYTNENGEWITPLYLKDDAQLTALQRKAIKKIKSTAHGIEIELHDKLKVLDMLIKRRSGYKEVRDINMSSNVEIVACVGDNGRGPKNDV